MECPKCNNEMIPAHCPRCERDERERIGAAIRIRRKQAGWSLREMAAKLKCSAPYLWEIETGSRAGMRIRAEAEKIFWRAGV